MESDRVVTISPSIYTVKKKKIKKIISSKTER